MLPVLLVALVACPSGDPELRARHDAIEAWEKGVRQLEAQDATAASRSFARALESQPGDPLLLAWEATALAQAGQLDQAIERLDRALEEQPNLVEARYNRAAYHARRGDPEAAAEDLATALQGGISLLPRDVLEDADFQPYLDHPAFVAVLPAETLTVAVEGPPGTVFRGSEFDVRLRIAGGGRDAIGVTAEEVRGPASLVEVIEDLVPSTEGPFRDITWRFRATGAGELTLGPFHVYAGTRTVMADPLVVRAAAPPGKEDPGPAAPLTLRTPRELARQLVAPAARLHEEGLLVMAKPGAKVEVIPSPTGEPVRYELRERGQPVWVLWHWTKAAPDVRVKILSAGKPVFDDAPQPRELK